MFKEETMYLEEESIDLEYAAIMERLEDTSDDSIEVQSRKRKRNHPITWEEKIQIKKLRNRIAAQTSRDRKKARMDYLEDAVKDLRTQNRTFQDEIRQLRKANEELVAKNAEITSNLAKVTCTCRADVRRTPEDVVSRVSDQLHPRPAESCDPQQKGSSWARAGVSTSPVTVLLRMLMICNLAMTSSTTGARQSDLPKYYSKILSSVRSDPSKRAVWDKILMPFAMKNQPQLLDWLKEQRPWDPPPLAPPCPA